MAEALVKKDFEEFFGVYKKLTKYSNHLGSAEDSATLRTNIEDCLNDCQNVIDKMGRHIEDMPASAKKNKFQTQFGRCREQFDTIAQDTQRNLRIYSVKQGDPGLLLTNNASFNDGNPSSVSKFGSQDIEFMP